MTQLYKLTESYRTIVELVFQDSDGEISQDYMAVLSNLTGDIDAKLAQLCRVVRELEAAEASAKVEATFFRDKASRASTAVERIKNYMKDNLESIGKTKRRVDSVFTVAIQQNPPSLDVFDLESVPVEFNLPAVRIVDRDAIKTLLKSGMEIPGCVLTKGTHVRIK